VVVWGVGTSTPEGDIRNFAEYMGLTFPILLDPKGTLGDSYNLGMAFPSAAFPQDWVIGTDGNIVYGNNHFEPDEMIAAIESEL
jgi:peroxiredoxin